VPRRRQASGRHRRDCASAAGPWAPARLSPGTGPGLPRTWTTRRLLPRRTVRPARPAAGPSGDPAASRRAAPGDGRPSPRAA